MVQSPPAGDFVIITDILWSILVTPIIGFVILKPSLESLIVNFLEEGNEDKKRFNQCVKYYLIKCIPTLTKGLYNDVYLSKLKKGTEVSYGEAENISELDFF